MDLAKVADLGCIVCRNHGFESPSEIHHIREGMGMGQRNDNDHVLPLCPQHHRAGYPNGFHHRPRTWQERFGTEIELLAQVKELLKN